MITRTYGNEKLQLRQFFLMCIVPLKSTEKLLKYDHKMQVFPKLTRVQDWYESRENPRALDLP